MARKAIIVFSVSCFFFCVSTVSASVLINEVKYSPTSKQWIEIYNDTDTDVDLTTFRILDSGASTSGHAISTYNNDSTVIPSRGYALVAKVPDDFTNAGCPVLKSSLNIKVSSDTLILKDDSGNIVSQVSINGTSPNENSLQLINRTWSETVPTSCSPNVASTGNSQIINSGNETKDTTSVKSTTKTETETKSRVAEIPKIKTKILGKNLAFVNIPVEFQTENLGYSGENLYYGKNYWNFGDGDSKEQIGGFDRFVHVFYYPGQYVVTLEYFSNQYSKLPDAINKMTVNVVSPQIMISSVGDSNDFYVEVVNNSDYEMDISGWALLYGDKRFTFPKNTIIENSGKIRLSPKITRFSYVEGSALKILSSLGQIMYEYESNNTSTNDVKKSTREISIKQKSYSRPKASIKFVDSVSASAIDTVADKNEVDNNNSFWFFLGFAILLVASSGAVYFVRKRKSVSCAGDDFQILDE